MNDEEQWQRWVKGFREGDADVAQEFWEEYGAMLHQVAEKHLAKGVRRRVGPESVVQSAFWTFVRRARGGEFQLGESKDLWSLLCAITLSKAREKTRFHLRQKRGLNQEVQAPLAGPGDDSEAGFDVAARDPTPAEAAAFSDQLQQLLDSLDEEEKQIVELKLQDYNNLEVAERLACSERTVRRVLKRLRSRLARLLGETE